MAINENEDLQLISRKELMRLLTISHSTMWRLEKEKMIPGRVILHKGRVAYRKCAIRQWLEEREGL
jgi:predicted DNA-binding transcriptional regulator AlpA